MKRILSFLLTLLMLTTSLPLNAFVALAEDLAAEASPLAGKTISILGASISTYAGKVISILGDSISTFAGYTPVADGFNLEHKNRYPQDDLLTDVNETWWMQVIASLDAKLGINDSWASTEVYNHIDAEVNSTSDGTKACMASLTRIQNLGANGTPDVILFFGGTNDITQSRPLGSFDPSTAPTEVNLTAVKWDTVADAYVAAIMRMQHFYPDARIVVLLPYDRSSQGTAKVEQYNSLFISICEHYGVPYVDLRTCGITNADLPDGTHPDANGMDYISAAVLEKLQNDVAIPAGEHVVHSVTHTLTNVKSSMGHYKGISHGKPFEATLTGKDLIVAVTMGGVDITNEVYEDGKIFIESVSGPLVITATGRSKTVYEDYLQELPEELCPGTNLWSALEPINLYYRSTGWGVNATGLAHSVTFPVSAGDRIWATSFGESGTNGGTKNGIALTWFDKNGASETFSPEKTYAEFSANGYLTAPEDAVAANVVMWNGNDENEIYVLNREHVYENGTCVGCGKKHAGKVISILSASTSTFAGYIPVADGFNLEHRARYPQDNLLTHVNDTWWMQTIHELNAKLGINDSWAGSQVLNTLDANSGDLGPDAAMASITRIKNLGSNGTPDVILFFGGGNDMGRGVALGSFDPATAPTEVNLTATKWETFADAYVAAIMRMQYFYPDAKILAMTTYPMPSYVTQAKLVKYGPVVQAICDHYGVEYLSLQDCGVTFEMLPDNIHPNAEGMDYITAAVVEKLKEDITLPAGEHIVHSVSHSLSGAKASLGYYKGISANKSFEETITGEDLTVTVTMGGADITATAYQNGVISIPAVTGDLVITAKGKFNADGHLQELPEEYCPGTNLWEALTPEKIYYTASGWGNTAAGTTWSVTFPVKEGDRIWATSFGAYPENGSSANGVRVTWFDENGVLQTLSRDVVYAEFARYGYITAPAGAVALNAPMTGNQDGYAVYILSADHSYTPIVTQPTCTEKGYTTYTCTVCGDSYIADEVAENGHSYTPTVTQPTATTQGYTTYTCEVCGDSYVSDYVDFTGFDSYEDAVAFLREQMVGRVPTVTLRLSGVQLTETEVQGLLDDARAHTGVPNEGDYIRYNRYSTSYSYTTGSDANGLYTEMTVNTTWFTTAEQEAEVDAAVAEILSELNLWDATDYEKIKGAYDWVCKNVVYDHDNLYDNTYLLKYSTYAAVIHKKAVCQGFASLFYRLCLELGVDCRVIAGYTDESHAWNIVKLGDKYYNMDPTYDRGTGNYYRAFLATVYSFGGYDRNAEYETAAFNAAYPMATLPYVEKVTASGTLSNGMEWIIDGETGILTVTGKGAIPAFRNWDAPWEPYADNITGIVLSEGITKVGDRAFAWCKNATTLSLPSTLKEICEYGFNNCRSLTTVELPAGLTTLGNCAFSECSGLTAVSLSGNLTNVGSSVFSNCPSLADITFGEGFTHIADSMFSNTAVTQLLLPDTIVSIGSAAFARCEKLTYVRIPASVTFIDHNAFINCSKLKQIGVVSDNPNYLSNFGVLFTKDAKTLVCFPAGMIPDRGTYTVPTGVTTIGDSAFYGASHVTRLVIPDSVTLIDDYAFAFCDGLYSVTIGENVTRLGDTAFGFCTNLTSITFANPKMEIDNYCFTHCVKLKSFTFPAEIPSLSPGILTDCHAITEIEIPKSVSAIGSGCFQFMKSLKKVTIPANIKRLDNCAFFNCIALEEVVVEGDLTYMDWSAFDTCTSLRYIRFKGSVSGFANTADRELFRDCPNLKAVYFDDAATAKKLTSATAFGLLGANAITIAVPKGTAGLSSFITSNFTVKNDVTYDGVTYTLYSKHTCTWYQVGSPAYVGCEIHYSYRCNSCYAQKQTVGYSHSYSVTVTPATCTEDGVETYTCVDCGDSFREILPATGHSYDWITTSPTCTADGRNDYFCLYCDHTYSETIPATGHSYDAVVTKPTCTEKGYTTYTCHCGDGYVADYANATGHSFGEWQTVTEAACTKDGLERKDCNNCDHYETKSIPATGHDYKSVVTKPTCTEKGYTTYTCHCGDSYVADYVNATGHTFGAWQTVTDATCIKDGSQRRDCQNCAHYETKSIPATGHSYNAVVTKPTCTEKGYTTYTCHCGDSYVSDYANATGHSFGAWQTVTDATCIKDGSQRRDCANCDHFETNTLPATGHNYKSVVTKPTCTEQGYTTYTCNACGDSYTANETPATGHSYPLVETPPTCTQEGLKSWTCQYCGHTFTESIPATGHSFGAWQTVTNPTCTKDGTERRDCANCDHYETRAIPATGHNYNATVTKPTCTEKGYTTYTCHCGDSYVDNYVDATGHSFGSWYTVTEATCTENGSERKDCANCNHFETNSIPATGHKHDSVVTAPTCTEKGYTTYTCHCGDSYVGNHTPATGHAWDAGVVTKEPTEETEGTKLYTCTVCGETKTETLPTLDHVHKYEEVVTPPTCTEQGYTTYTCTCSDSYVSDYANATGHSFGDWCTVTESTCTANGSERRACANCDHYETQAIPATGHSYQATVTQPNCTEQGYTTYTCHCGDSYVADYVDATGHTFGEWKDTAPGKEERSCAACGETESRDKIPNYDVDGNGTVNQADAELLLAILVGNAVSEVLHDFDFDGILTIYDCVLLMQQIR